MRVYHGTVEAFLPSIQSEGLKFVPQNSFEMDGIKPIVIEPCVYLSTTRRGAMMMAWIKAIYLAVDKGEMIPGTEWDNWKTGDLQIKTKPVLLTLDIPKDAKLKHDPDWGDNRTGLIFCGTIPPTAIEKVEVLDDNPPAD